MNHSSVKPQTVMVNNITSHNNMIVVVVYIVNQYCVRFEREVVHIVAEVYIVNQYCVRFDRGMVHIVVLLSQTSHSTG
jgi:hypothetical protein